MFEAAYLKLERNGELQARVEAAYRRLAACDLCPRRCGVDPSNLSSVVDQLTERGLMTSRPAQHDKRVRIVRLTGEGARMRKRLLACLAENPAVDSLSPARQKQLLEILRDVA